MRNRINDNTFYCPFRTFHVQEGMLTVHPSDISLGIDRLFWVKCVKGYLDYRLLDNVPLSCSPTKEVTFNISSGLLPMKYDRNISRHDRVG